MFGLQLQDSVATIERVLREQGKLADWDYLKDDTFQRFVVDGSWIQTSEDAFAFADLLQSQCSTCSKAHVIRSYLREDGFWSRNFSSLLAHARRTCCWNHETGSFFVRD